MCASHWVHETQRRSESKGFFWSLGVILNRRNPGASHRPRFVRSIKSVHAETRKMVNYAWPG
jgi:hypothetical protein